MQLDFLQSSNTELKQQIKDLTEKITDIEKDIIRFGHLEEAVHDMKKAKNGHAPNTHNPSSNFNDMANQWFHSKVAERVFWAAGIIAAALLARYAGVLWP